MRTESPGRQVPAIVVSGFLGSGKTSVVRWLLDDARRRGARAAVVSNEFGALGIDKELLSGGAEAIIELDGGCVCCQLSNDLLDTIVRLRERVDPDLFIVETSGLALASETLLAFWREPVRAWISDDIGVVVVSAEQVQDGRDLVGTFEDQLGAADVILLNKVDQVEASDLEAIEALLRRIEPEAPIVRVEHGRVDPAILVPSTSVRRQPVAIPAQAHGHDRFVSNVLEIAPGQPRERIAEQVRQGQPIRAKGFVEAAEGTLLLQLVGPRLSFTSIERVIAPTLLGRVVVVHRAGADVAVRPSFD